MKKSILFFLFVVLTLSSFRTSAMPQVPSATGRWQIDLSLNDGRQHSIRFDANADGTGTYLLLDSVSSLNPSPQPQKASWQPLDNGLKVTGHMEFPIGNVGIDVGTLTLTGTFSDSNTLTGGASFANDATQTIKSGTFVAHRITDTPTAKPTVQLLTPSAGDVLRRGNEVNVMWNLSAANMVTSQQLFLSVDKGKSFTPISISMDNSQTSFKWQISTEMGKIKKARLKVVVVDVNGNVIEDVSDGTFRIK